MYHKLFRDALHPWNRCITKGCISVYWRACRWYDWTGFTWRLFSIPVIHLTWLDETVPSCVKCIIHFVKMCSASLKAVHCKMMHIVYWRACRWYDCSTVNISLVMVDSSLPKLMHKFFRDAVYSREELLSSTCSTANISVAMVDRSPPKFCLQFWGILHIIES